MGHHKDDNSSQAKTRKPCNVRRVLTEVLEIAGKDLQLLNPDNLVRLVMMLNTTCLKVEDQAVLVDRAWEDYFQAIHYQH